MPRAPRRACHAGCPNFQPCPVHSKRKWASSATVSAAERGYGSEHRALRRQVLREEPVCRTCCSRLTTICDHIRPLSRGGLTVRANLQGLCDECGRAKTGREGRAARSTFASGHTAGPKPDGPPVPSSRGTRDFDPLPGGGP
jgi:5-methylcytosine-specific restriction protein A